MIDANAQTSSFTYDASGDRLTASTPKNTNQLVNTYDVLGRRLSATDLDRGAWSYTYDSLGELLTQTSPIENANTETTTLGYDVLGRLTSRSEPDMSSAWEYDQATNGVGLVDNPYRVVLWNRFPNVRGSR